MQKAINFSSFDGTMLNGVLASPDEGAPRGGVLLLHGSPSEKNEGGFHSDAPEPEAKYKKLGGMVEYLTVSGFMSLRFDYREQGDNHKTPNMENLSVSGMISDSESGYHVLRSNLGTDAPIFVVGTSFAGGLAVKWLVSYNRTISYLFLMAPLLDFSSTIRKTDVIERDALGMERLTATAVANLNRDGFLVSGGKKMSREFLNEVMMMNLEEDFKRLSCKSLIFHGTIDPIVPYQTSAAFVGLSHGMSELIPVEAAVHGFGQEGDLEWETDQTRLNHETIYQKMIARMVE